MALLYEDNAQLCSPAASLLLQMKEVQRLRQPADPLDGDVPLTGAQATRCGSSANFYRFNECQGVNIAAFLSAVWKHEGMGSTTRNGHEGAAVDRRPACETHEPMVGIEGMVSGSGVSQADFAEVVRQEDFDMPVVRSRIGELLERMAPGAIQRIPAEVERTPGSFEILNVLSAVDCLDEERSGVTYWTEADIDVNDRELGAWWETAGHRKAAHAYNQEWRNFFRGNENAGREQVLEYGRELARRFGLDVRF